MIGVIGAGNLGANTAFFLAEHNIGTVYLYDIQEGLAAGKALDIMEAAPVRQYQYGVLPAANIQALHTCKVIVIAAGTGRTAEGASRRAELAAENAPLIADIAEQLKGYTGVVLLATEPVDVFTAYFQNLSGIDTSRVLGLGCALDAERMQVLVSEALQISPENVTALVVGRHNKHMVPLPQYTRVSGVPISALLDEAAIQNISDTVKNAGDELVAEYQRGSAYYGAAAVACTICRAVLWNTEQIISTSFVWSGQYDIRCAALSLPAVLGSSGIVRVLEPQLSDSQLQSIQKSAEALKQELQDIVGTNTGGAQ